MADMKFKFTIQPYQTEAVESVVGVFAGQPFNDRFTYRRDVEIKRDVTNWMIPEEELYMGFANARVQLDSGQLLNNIRRIQTRNNIKLSENVMTGGLGACSLDVEMETGTGKTYVYIKTMFELNKQYGWSKFIVVVPSIAIREGVRKSFETMQDHFMEYYGKKARFFVYDSKNLAEIDNFSQSADINVMIINIQAFNARGKDARRIRTELDDFGSRKPIDVIKANRPIVILDEPQKMGGTATQESLKEFNPLFCLNYSATHKQHHELVYVLDALDAYNKRLVKRIEVKGFDIKNLRGTDSYLFLEGIVISPKKPPMARIEFEIGYNKSINRETRLLGVDDDLFTLSKNMNQYRGYRISEIDPIRGIVTFTNGETIHAGEVVGDVSEADLRRVQIRETIRSHFEKEKDLFSRGIKTLSLFFIDEVAKYRKYDDDGNEVNSQYGEIFEQEYMDTYLYIDKRMQDHGLFQAICRVNRLDDDSKDFGYIVDYKQLFGQLQTAMKDYTSGAFEGYDPEDVKGLVKDRHDATVSYFEEVYDAVEELCEGVEEPRGEIQYIHYFCGVSGQSEESDEIYARLREKLYRLVSSLVRAFAEAKPYLVDANSMNPLEKNVSSLEDYLKLPKASRYHFCLNTEVYTDFLDVVVNAKLRNAIGHNDVECDAVSQVITYIPNPKDRTIKKTEYLLEFENEAMHMFQALLGVSEYLYRLRELSLMYDGKIRWEKTSGSSTLR